jgi:N-glycosylase/DNA lyase
MKLTAIEAPDFDLAVTLDSGQVFHWEPHGAGFIGTIDDVPLYVEQRGEQLLVSGDTASIAARYFALDHPLAEICAAFPEDAAMCAARDYCRGLRILRQPIWECLASFITSSMKQVAHIRQMSRALREQFGTRHSLYVTHVYAYPSAQRLARASEEQLRACGLGYRAKNLLLTAQRVASGEADLEGWRELPDDELRAQLCTLPGVGTKVANCVMLFAYERLRAVSDRRLDRAGAEGAIFPPRAEADAETVARVLRQLLRRARRLRAAVFVSPRAEDDAAAPQASRQKPPVAVESRSCAPRRTENLSDDAIETRAQAAMGGDCRLACRAPAGGILARSL